MSIVVTHTTPADATFSPAGQAAWDAAHALSGAADLSQGGTNNTATPSAGQIIFSDGTKLTSDANLTWDATNGLLVQKNISCPGTGTNSERFGNSSSTAANLDVVIGQNAAGPTSAGSGSNVVIGQGANTNSFNNVVIGQGSSIASGFASVCIGQGNSVSTSNVIAIGSSATVTSNGLAAFGKNVTSSHQASMVFGTSSLNALEMCFGLDSTLTVNQAPSFLLVGNTNLFGGFVVAHRSAFRISTAWIDATDATRKSRAVFNVFDTAEREFMRADAAGVAAVNVAFLSGGSLITQGATLGTTATDGFLYIPTSAGAPTGAPTAQTGTVATEYDTTNDALQVYNGAWKTCPTQATGSWTPADNSGAALSFTGVSASYTKIGNMVFAYATWTYPVTASGANASISGLPFASANANYAQVPSVVDTSASITGGLVAVPVKNTTTLNFDVGTPFGPATNLQLSTASVAVMLIYPVA